MGIKFFEIDNYSNPNTSDEEATTTLASEKKLEGEKPKITKHLKVVYFYPNDVQPQDKYKERLTRVMLDVKSFFKENMMHHGYENNSLPLEMDSEGMLELHLVKGQNPSKFYSNNRSMINVLNETTNTLTSEFNVKNEYVLIISGMCIKNNINEYLFHAPYLGFSPSVDNDHSTKRINRIAHKYKGVAFAADCEMLDANFEDNNKYVKYTEMKGTFNEKLSKFRLKYIGGIAHELGHGLGIKHNNEYFPLDKKVSLMGSGNLYYRGEDGGISSYLTPTTALQLSKHPLFTQRDNSKNSIGNIKVTSLNFSNINNGIHVDAKLANVKEDLDIIVYLKSNNKEHATLSYLDKVKVGNKISTNVHFKHHGSQILKIEALHPTGESELLMKINFESAENDTIDIKSLVQSAAQYFIASQYDLSTLSIIFNDYIQAESLNSINEVSTTNKKSLYLSDIKPYFYALEYGKFKPNAFYIKSTNAELYLTPFIIKNKLFNKGIYAHANSVFLYKLGKRWKTLNVSLGIQDSSTKFGSASFVIKGDGKELFHSGQVKRSELHEINIDVSNVNELELITAKINGDNSLAHSVWVDPVLKR